ncbi:MAG: nucleoside triphosphate pyrophosphohydrolase [Deltaproteobacteria bacterium]|nr:MAG: nucleoside triphosphate pyrophosphohydrolase [Deltaproteobacteria bacterium]
MDETAETDEQRGEKLPRLVKVMRDLLAPDGCAWDREQTLQTLRPYVIEEAFEVVDAIDRGSPEMLKEELGDLLLQIVFQGELAQRSGWFGHDDIVDAVCEKLIRRHPHVFGDETASDSASALANWERLKKKEKAGRGALDGVPAAMPALLRAVRVGEKASAVGYDWPDVSGARAKVDEELGELDRALAADETEAAEAELGDVLFALASLGRKRGLDPEAALRGTLDRFSKRFTHAESAARKEGKGLDELDAAALDALWERAKAEEL